MDLLKSGEAAEYLRMSRSTFRRRVASDPAVPRVKVDGMVRYRRSDLRAWVERNTQREGAEG